MNKELPDLEELIEETCISVPWGGSRVEVLPVWGCFKESCSSCLGACLWVSQVSWFLLHFLRGSSTVRTHQHLRLNPDSDSFPRYSKLKTICRDFLVGQWLRLRAPKTGGPVQSMVRELDSTCGPDPGRPNKYLLKKKKTL